MNCELNTVPELEDLLSRPTEKLVEAFRNLDGDIIILGAGGKMGLSLSTMAFRASREAGVDRRIICVSRFSNSEQLKSFQSLGLETIQCDLLNEAELNALPLIPNVVYMPALKFGGKDNRPVTWAMNTLLPSLVCRHFESSRIVAFSTGNVYGLTNVKDGGSLISDEPSPAGEYAMSCLGRERMFEYFSSVNKIPMALIRLNYACELRYGVLVDIALKVQKQEPIDLTMGFFNVIWQGDANAMSLTALTKVKSPPVIFNVTGPELISVKEAALRFGELLGSKPVFTGVESPTAILSKSTDSYSTLGSPLIRTEQLYLWIASWLKAGGKLLGKPTGFQNRAGNF